MRKFAGLRIAEREKFTKRLWISNITFNTWYFGSTFVLGNYSEAH